MSLASLLLPEGEFRVVRCDIIDKLIACSDGDSALLYLYILRSGQRFDEKTAMRTLGYTQERYDRAAFTLTSLTIRENTAAVPADAASPPKYSISELREAREGDHKFAAVCVTAEDALGRTLSEGQLRSLFTIYDHIGLPPEVIIELLCYLKRDKGLVKRRDIEREAYLWSDMGIYTAKEAQAYLARREAQKPLEGAMLEAMHIVGREPVLGERRLIAETIEKGFSPDAVALAVRRMEQNIGKFSLSYLKKILTLWEEKGIHTVSEITAIEPETAHKNKPASTPSGTPDRQLESWEREWLDEVERRRTRHKEE